MSSYQGKHSQPSRATKNIAKIALAGAIIGAPVVLAAAPANAVNWDAVAQCESGGNWGANTGNGYYGGLQFTAGTWKANGGSGSPAHASREDQIRVAENVARTQGMHAWPHCGTHGGASGGRVHASAPKKTASAQSAPRQAAAVPAVAVARPQSNPSGDYVVQTGDTLTKIAKDKQIAGGWSTLMDKNKGYIFDKDLILVGQKIATK